VGYGYDLMRGWGRPIGVCGQNMRRRQNTLGGCMDKEREEAVVGANLPNQQDTAKKANQQSRILPSIVSRVDGT